MIDNDMMRAVEIDQNELAELLPNASIIEFEARTIYSV